MLEAARCLEERLPQLPNADSAGAGVLSQPSRHWGRRQKCVAHPGQDPEGALCSVPSGLTTQNATLNLFLSPPVPPIERSVDGLATMSSEGGKIAKPVRVKACSERNHTSQSEGYTAI